MGANVFQQRARQQIHRLPLLFVAAAMAIGIVADVAIDGIFMAERRWAVLWLPLCAVCVAAALLTRSKRRLVSIFIAIIPLAAAWHAVCNSRFDSATVSAIISTQREPAVVTATVDRPMVLRRHPLAGLASRRGQSPWQSQLEARVDQVRIGQSLQSFTGRVLIVSNGKLDDLLPGDQIEVFGLIRSFPRPTNPGQRDLRNVYRRRGLHARIDVDSAEQIVSLTSEAPGGGRVYRAVAATAGFSREVLIDHTSKVNGPLALALVIGQREMVDQQTRDLLLVTGTAHLLSVSGLHLAIVVVIARWIGLAIGFPTAVRIVWILSVCALYTAITGGRPPVLRAAILVATFVVSIWIRRQGQPINTLSLAAIILLVINPENLFSVGVQLSFLAVATLLLCGRRAVSSTPAVEQTLQREQRLEDLRQGALPAPVRYGRLACYWIWQAIWFSGCVTAVSVPLVWHQFHVVSLISVLTNVVLGPFLFVGLASGVATVVSAVVWEPLAVYAGWLCDRSLTGMTGVIDFAASIPCGHFWLPAPPTLWVAMFYGVLGALMILPLGPTLTWMRRSWVVIWVLAAWWMATTPAAMDDGGIEATFVDVGHGTSVVLRFSEQDVWLYDCGRMGNDTGSSRDIDAALWSLGVTRLAGIMLSHADADHYNAVPGVLRRFSVGRIITPPGMLREAEEDLQVVRRKINRAGIPVQEVSAGATINTTPALRVLHPPRDRIAGSDNANSLVVTVQHAGAVLILPGDLEPPGTSLLVNQGRPDPGGALMAPHHGSLTMDATAVMQWARPRETIVSGGRRARRAEVRQMLAAFGSGVHITAEVGAIRVRIGEDGKIAIRNWTLSPW